jgi:hypothetical protein
MPTEHTPYTIAWLERSTAEGSTKYAIEAEVVTDQAALTSALARRRDTPFLVFEGRCKPLKVKLVDHPRAEFE